MALCATDGKRTAATSAVCRLQVFTAAASALNCTHIQAKGVARESRARAPELWMRKKLGILSRKEKEKEEILKSSKQQVVRSSKWGVTMEFIGGKKTNFLCLSSHAGLPITDWMTSMFLATETSWPVLFLCSQTLFCLFFCTPSCCCTSCPEQCQCTNYSGATAVLCSASNLEEIPTDIPKDTMFLKLDANKITAVPNSTFRHLAHLQEIDLSKNAIEKIDSAAFKGVADGLRLLDLSGNHIQRIPKEALVNLNAMIRLSNNPWHCECTLQEVLWEVKLDPDSVNEITCQTSVQEEYAGKPLLHILDSGINFCNMHQKTTDVAMFVTMFSWFTLVISYVVYYVRHNQEDTKKHLEYLKSLPSTRVPKETISTIL